MSIGFLRTTGGRDGGERYTYDPHGRVLAITDANNRTRRIVYDRVGRVVRATNELGEPVDYEYDRAGNRVRLTDGNGNPSLFTYDRDGYVTSLTYPGVAGVAANVERYQYDAVGQLVAKTTPNGAVIRSLYDPAGQVVALYTGEEVATPEAIPADRLLVRYEYDAAGDIVREVGPNAVMAYLYDSHGRLAEAKDEARNIAARYTYYPNGSRQTVELRDYTRQSSLVEQLYYHQGPFGMTRVVNLSGAVNVRMEYNRSGLRSRTLHGYDMVTSYRYDPHGRLLDLATRRGEDLVSRFSYRHDPAGNRTGITYPDGSRSEYAFDDAYRLTRDRRVDADGATVYDETYTYDRVGNRLTKRRTGWNPVAVDYAYNTRSQLVRTTGTDAATYAYDPDGNLIAVDRGNAGSKSMTYDVLGRLTRYQGLAGVENYTHIGAGWKRHSVSTQPVNGEAVTTSYLYDGDNVLADLNAGTVENIYATHDLDEPLALILARGGHYYYTHDGLGSVRNLTTGNGSVQSTYDYTAFGELFNAAAGVTQRYGYTGREMERLGGGMHYRYRQYDPKSGRFGRRDPAGYDNNEFLNLYDYVYNEALEFKDPFGLGMDGKHTYRRSPDWEKDLAGLTKCLADTCTDACDPNGEYSVSKCKDDASKIAAEIAFAYEGLRRRSQEGANPNNKGWWGNRRTVVNKIKDDIFNIQPPVNIGCDNTTNAITNGFKSGGIFEIYPRDATLVLPHRYPVIRNKFTGGECAVTAWDTATPSGTPHDKYGYSPSALKRCGDMMRESRRK